MGLTLGVRSWPFPLFFRWRMFSLTDMKCFCHEKQSYLFLTLHLPRIATGGQRRGRGGVGAQGVSLAFTHHFLQPP